MKSAKFLFPISVILTVLALMVLPLCAQQKDVPPSQPSDQAPQAQSLAEVAKQAQKNKSAHAKKLITEDELDEARGPLPRMNMEGTDNADEIISAIGTYHDKHSSEETEQVVHDWYDNYDTLLEASIRDTTESRDRRDSTLFTGFQLCQGSDDYQKCELKRQAEMRGARHDQQVMRDDGNAGGAHPADFNQGSRRDHAVWARLQVVQDSQRQWEWKLLTPQKRA